MNKHRLLFKMLAN